eukprot:gene15596-biopygen3249
MLADSRHSTVCRLAPGSSRLAKNSVPKPRAVLRAAAWVAGGAVGVALAVLRAEAAIVEVLRVLDAHAAAVFGVVGAPTRKGM